MAVLSRPWPFYQGRSSQVARHPDFGRGLQSRAISLSAAGPSYFQQKQVQWPFYQREAQWPLSKQKQPGWPDLQISATNCNFGIIPHNQFISGRAKLFSAKAGPMANGRFIKAEATGWPDLQISATNCNFGIIPHNQFISGRAKLFSAKAGPMAALSTRPPMAVLSKQKQPDARANMELAIRGSSLATWLLLL